MRRPGGNAGLLTGDEDGIDCEVGVSELGDEVGAVEGREVDGAVGGLVVTMIGVLVGAVERGAAAGKLPDPELEGCAEEGDVGELSGFAEGELPV